MTIVITSNTSSQSFNNQVYALDKEIDDAIKKACPTYQGNNNIKDLVTDIFKACIPDNIQSPPTTPNPDISPLDQNILHLIIGNDDLQPSITVTTTDVITQKASIKNFFGSTGISDEYYVIPVGNSYNVTVTSEEGLDPGQVNFESNDCTASQFIVSCTGTMDNSLQTVDVSITPFQQ